MNLNANPWMHSVILLNGNHDKKFISLKTWELMPCKCQLNNNNHPSSFQVNFIYYSDCSSKKKKLIGKKLCASFPTLYVFKWNSTLCQHQLYICNLIIHWTKFKWWDDNLKPFISVFFYLFLGIFVKETVSHSFHVGALCMCVYSSIRWLSFPATRFERINESK